MLYVPTKKTIKTFSGCVRCQPLFLFLNVHQWYLLSSALNIPRKCNISNSFLERSLFVSDDKLVQVVDYYIPNKRVLTFM